MSARILCVLPLVALLGACGGWVEKSSAKSPDGTVSAKLLEGRRGKPDSNGTRVALENEDDGKLLKEGDVLWADGVRTTDTQVKWDGPDHLLVKICNPSQYDVTSLVQRDDDEPSVRIDVQTFRYSDQDKRCVPT